MWDAGYQLLIIIKEKLNNTILSSNYVIRPISDSEIQILKEFLYLAIFVGPDGAPYPKEIVDEPIFSKSYEKWGRTGDIALVALNDETKMIIGAAWVRLFKKNDPSFGFVDENTPNMVIAIKKEYRCKGIGTQLLNNLINTIKENGFNAISLSVDPRNPAIRLYKRLGFEIIKHVEGESYTMLLKV